MRLFVFLIALLVPCTQIFAATPAFLNQRLITGTNEPVDRIFYSHSDRTSDNLNATEFNSYNEPVGIQIVQSTVDPMGNVFFKVCRFKECSSKKYSWIPHEDEFERPNVDEINLTFDFNDDGIRQDVDIKSLQAYGYTPWSKLRHSQKVTEFYDREFVQHQEYEVKSHNHTADCKHSDNSSEAGASLPISNGNYSVLSEIDKSIVSSEDEYMVKTSDELDQYFEMHQKGENNCGLAEEGDEFKEYKKLYKTYLNSAASTILNSGDPNQGALFSCLVFQESKFDVVTNSGGYSGLGQMGKDAYLDAQKMLNSGDGNKLYLSYVSRINQSRNHQDFVASFTARRNKKKVDSCPLDNSKSFFKGMSGTNTWYCAKARPDMQIAGSAGYFKLGQNLIASTLNSKNAKYTQAEFYALTAMAYNAGPYVTERKLKESLGQGLSVGEAIRVLPKRIVSSMKWGKEKLEEITNYPSSIRNCMEKKNFAPRCSQEKQYKVTHSRTMICARNNGLQFLEDYSACSNHL